MTSSTVKDDTNVFKINKEPQQKLLAYFFSHADEIIFFPTKYFVTPILYQIAKAILHLVESEINCTLDELTTFCKKINVNIEYNQLAEIEQAFTDFTNIDFVKKEVKEQWVKYNLFNDIVKDIAVNLSQDGSFNRNKLKTLAEDLHEKIDEIDRDEVRSEVKDFSPSYKEILSRRNNGEAARTFGFSNLNNIITRPLTPGEISFIFGLSGSYKSNFVLNIVQQLVTLKIPVLYYSLENSIDEDVFDRLVAIRGDIDFTSLDEKNKNPRLINKIDATIDRLEKQELLLMPDIPSLSLKILDNDLGRYRKIFRNKGVFSPYEEYFVVVIDMFTQLTDFGDMQPGHIEKIMNQTQVIMRKHKVPILAVAHANENKIRGKNFSDISDLEKFFLTKEDIKYGSAFADKTKGVVISLKRMKDLKMKFFPDQNEITEKEPDILECFIVKQNKGFLGKTKFAITDSLRTVPLKE